MPVIQIPPKWSQVAGDHRFAGLDDAGKQRVREQWLEDVHAAGKAGGIQDYRPEAVMDLAREIGAVPEPRSLAFDKESAMAGPSALMQLARKARGLLPEARQEVSGADSSAIEPEPVLLPVPPPVAPQGPPLGQERGGGLPVGAVGGMASPVTGYGMAGLFAGRQPADMRSALGQIQQDKAQRSALAELARGEIGKGDAGQPYVEQAGQRIPTQYFDRKERRFFTEDGQRIPIDYVRARGPEALNSLRSGFDSFLSSVISTTPAGAEFLLEAAPWNAGYKALGLPHFALDREKLEQMDKWPFAEYERAAENLRANAERYAADVTVDGKLTEYLKDGDYQSAGRWFVYNTIQNAPQVAFQALATIVGGPGAALGLLAASAAGAKNEELRKQHPWMNSAIRLTNSVVTGAAEYWSERVGTQAILKKVLDPSARRLFAQSAAGFMREIFRAGGRGALEGSISQFGENLADIATGVPGATLTEDVPESIAGETGIGLLTLGGGEMFRGMSDAAGSYITSKRRQLAAPAPAKSAPAVEAPAPAADVEAPAPEAAAVPPPTAETADVTQESTEIEQEPPSAAPTKPQDMGLAEGTVVVDASRDTPEHLAAAERDGMVVNRFPLAEINFDPARFQYKRGAGQQGQTGALAGVKKYDPVRGGVLAVWRDPANGKVYVVNGHNRAAKAIELGETSHPVQFLRVDTAKEARAYGALINIAEGRGTVLDAAKFFRDTEMTQEAFDALNLPLSEARASRGLALSRLTQTLFDMVVAGDLDEGVASVIGERIPEKRDQLQMMKALRGHRLSLDVVREFADLAVNAPKVTEKQIDLFGESEEEKSLLLEKAKVSAAINKRLAADKNLFGRVASESAAKRLGVAGNVIDPETNKAVSEEAATIQFVFNKLKHSSMAGILNRAAEEVYRGRSITDVVEEVFPSIQAGVAEALGRGEGESIRGGAEDGGDRGVASEPKPPELDLFSAPPVPAAKDAPVAEPEATAPAVSTPAAPAPKQEAPVRPAGFTTENREKYEAGKDLIGYDYDLQKWVFGEAARQAKIKARKQALGVLRGPRAREFIASQPSPQNEYTVEQAIKNEAAELADLESMGILKGRSVPSNWKPAGQAAQVETEATAPAAPPAKPAAKRTELAELRARAKELGIKGRTTMTTPKLRAAIASAEKAGEEAAGAPPPVNPPEQMTPDARIRQDPPQVARPTALDPRIEVEVRPGERKAGKGYAIPGAERLRVTVVPPYGNKAKGTASGWSVWVGNARVYANLPGGTMDTAEQAISVATPKLRAIAKQIVRSGDRYVFKGEGNADVKPAAARTIELDLAADAKDLMRKYAERRSQARGKKVTARRRAVQRGDDAWTEYSVDGYVFRQDGLRLSLPDDLDADDWNLAVGWNSQYRIKAEAPPAAKPAAQKAQPQADQAGPPEADADGTAEDQKKERAKLLRQATRKGMVASNEDARELGKLPIDELRARVQGQEAAAIAAELERAPRAAADFSAMPAVDPAKMPKRPPSASDIIAQARREFNILLRFGKTGRDMGWMNHATKVMRMNKKVARSLGVFFHELGHALNKDLGILAGAPKDVIAELAALDYDPKKRRASEGFAEYIMRVLWRDDADTFAPNTHAWFFDTVMPKHKDVARKLQWLKTQATIRRSMDADTLVATAIRTAPISDPRSIPARIADAWRKLATKWDDRFDAVHRFYEYARVRAKAQGKSVADWGSGDNAYTWALAYYRKEGAVATDVFENGVKSLITGRRLSVGLRAAIREAGIETVEAFDAFTRFLYARHARDVLAKGMDPGIGQTEADAVYEKYKDTPGWAKLADTVTAWNNAHLRMQGEVGGLGEAEIEAMTAAWPTYIPLRRVREAFTRSAGGRKPGRVPVGAPVAARRGADLDIEDPWTAMIQKSEAMYRSAISQRIATMIIDVADPARGGVAELGRWVERVKTPMASVSFNLGAIEADLAEAGVNMTDEMRGMIVNLWRTSFRTGADPVVVLRDKDTQQWVAYQLDRDLYDALAYFAGNGTTGSPAEQMVECITAMLSPISRAKRFGAVVARPSFGAGMNPMRDVAEMFMKTRGSAALVIPRFIGSMIRVASDASSRQLARGEGDPLISMARAFGVKQAGWIGQDLQEGYKKSREIINDALKRRDYGIVLRPIDLLRKVVDEATGALATAELAPRVADMKSVLAQKGYTVEDIKNDTVPIEAQVEAVFAALNVTTNFGRSGTIPGMLNQIKAFFNVGIQGPMQSLRASGLDPREFNLKLAGRTMLRGSTMTMAAMAYWWANRDEDWYKELPAWRKVWFWNFRIGETTLSLPVGFVYGWIFKALPEAILNRCYEADGEAMTDAFVELYRNVGPDATSVLPDAVTLGVEMIAGYDFWRDRPIVPEYVRRESEPRDWASDYNTGVSKALGAKFNWSPAYIDHALRSATGGMATDLLRIPEEGAARAIGFRRFTPPFDVGKSVDAFYKRKEELRRAVGSDRKAGTKQEGAIVELRQMERYAKQLKELRDKRAGLAGNTEAQAAVSRQMTGLARKALGLPALREYPAP